MIRLVILASVLTVHLVGSYDSSISPWFPLAQASLRDAPTDNIFRGRVCSLQRQGCPPYRFYSPFISWFTCIKNGNNVTVSAWLMES